MTGSSHWMTATKKILGEVKRLQETLDGATEVPSSQGQRSA